ncbi:endo alpha-1,4 polygalactosaminidase [Marinitenerispora sediminis]|uniref:endo alpha-1,4 polygalactosaminidase n=1 Tax=Marinitenerispora sediminis TaxID=1931232 RepID=UPI0021618E25|nr:endo alpha-1,4 polygalactosaminidase [Marinitenerispora sediminis]
MTLLPPSVLVLALGLAAGCAPASDVQSASGAEEEPAAAAPVPMPADPVWDYQIGGGYPPAEDVQVVLRDREDESEPGRYSVCYVNGFQAQEHENEWWVENHRDLLLWDADGEPVMDDFWDEQFLDLRTEEQRDDLVEIMGGWMAGCAAAGFQGVEVDNLDSYTRSGGLIGEEAAFAYARLLVERAHAEGLTIGQKNAAEATALGVDAGFDFAVAEECARWDECASYAEAYPGRVLDVEYRREDFETACERDAGIVSVILRDLDVTPEGDPAHVREVC